jgi:hypothetical protein
MPVPRSPRAEKFGFKLSLPPDEMVTLGWADSEGLQQMAAIDFENDEFYDRLAERLFTLLAQAPQEPVG